MPVVIKACEYCGIDFSAVKRANRPGPPRFCSRMCFHSATAAKEETRSCLWCQNTFTYLPVRQPTRRFCTPSCASSWKQTQPGFKEKIYTTERAAKVSASLKQWWANSGPAQEAQRIRITNLKPMLDPVSRAKVSETLKRRGYQSQLRGGNGRGMSAAQMLLLSSLGTGWESELVVATGTKGNGMPSHWKIDIAHQTHMIAVEVDGSSHRSRKVKERDLRKDLFLASCGWKVLRFTNQEVISSLDTVMERIESHFTM